MHMVSCTKYFGVYKVICTGQTRRALCTRQSINKREVTYQQNKQRRKWPEKARDRKNSRNDKNQPTTNQARNKEMSRTTNATNIQ